MLVWLASSLNIPYDFTINDDRLLLISWMSSVSQASILLNLEVFMGLQKDTSSPDQVSLVCEEDYLQLKLFQLS